MPAGWGRLAVALPVLAVLQLPPFLFNPLTETWAVVLSLNFPWLSVCAVLGWAMGRGPQAQPFPHYLAFLAFLVCPALPCTVRPTEPAAGRRVQRTHQFGQWEPAAKVAVLAAAATAFDCLVMPHWLTGILQSLALFCFTSLCLEVAAAAASLVSGMPVLAPFNRPEFWGAQWNVVAGTTFRTTVYEPLCQGLFAGQTAAAAAPWRRVVAMLATFAASGAVHELAFFHLTRRLSGRWFLFFTVQGPLLLAEAGLGRLCRQAGVQVPLPVRVATATATVHMLAHMLFFPDIVEAGVPRRMLHQLLPGGLCGGGGGTKLSTGG
ncbi:hypothetical protein CHLNCDRAFT_141220 [Chlorella variabilis]|uniref:Wax synthase domain-containing protein n=1 Tax=Chlorella variabilis TaxID=554065 RepID=E1ZSC8_CHLVA|nr:hypothetical protein CHLNCDRAFT_141220 [Chlorella variabilis]EFN51224.1 hypothetical protein CHLNCDRAFT_141220 [Chlorella variabilis]|eukprot:XP_005843326.1 hypothetical protein CHLNCDRAFT_141220 [Chlorella variabilis]